MNLYDLFKYILIIFKLLKYFEINSEKEGYEIKLGISDLKNPEEWSRKIVPEKIFTNNYLSTNGNKFTMKNDIALIKLREPVEFSDYISPVCIATSVMSVPAGGELVWITDFGKTKVGSSTASFLQQTQIAISTLEQCDNALNFWTDVNRDEIICTEDTGSNTCNGTISRRRLDDFTKLGLT